MDPNETRQDLPRPFIDHLIELRKRLLICLAVFVIVFIGCTFFSQSLFQFILAPLTKLLKVQGQGRHFIYTGLPDAFVTYLKVAFFSALFITFPLWAFQIWGFIAPGLYDYEKNLFRFLMVATPFLFFIGSFFAYIFVFPWAYGFFLSFEWGGAVPLHLEPKIDDYLSLVIRFIFAFGICFELPVILTLLARTGMVTSHLLKENWRLATVIIFFAAACLTPPDLISMIALGVPLMGLYFFSFLMVGWVEKNKGKNHA